jgi:hypothetical protein
MTRHQKIVVLYKWYGIQTIWDALAYIEKLQKKLWDKWWENWETNTFWLLLAWNDKKANIQYQSDNCIDYVYSLIK